MTRDDGTEDIIHHRSLPPHSDLEKDESFNPSENFSTTLGTNRDGEAKELDQRNEEDTATGDPLRQPLLPIPNEPLPLQSYSRLEQSSPPMATHSSQRIPSLADTSSRTVHVSLLLAMLITHGLFLYGQVKPFWHIQLLQDYDLWVNATTTQSKWAFDAIGYDHNLHFYTSQDEQQPPQPLTLETYTFGYMISELWYDTPGKLFSRCTAVLLFLCSGVWPHVKLWALYRTFQSPRFRKGSHRHDQLQWLAMLGKWSLVDVWTVAIFIVVGYYPFHIDPDRLHAGLIRKLPRILDILRKSYTVPQLCSVILGYSCSRPSKFAHVTQCRACTTFLQSVYAHPEWAATTGQSIIQGIAMGEGTPRNYDSTSSMAGTSSQMILFHIQGLSGIYVYCIAVLCSMLMNLYVEYLHRHYKHRHHNQQQQSVLRSSDSEMESDLVASSAIDSCHLTPRNHQSDNLELLFNIESQGADSFDESPTSTTSELHAFLPADIDAHSSMPSLPHYDTRMDPLQRLMGNESVDDRTDHHSVSHETRTSMNRTTPQLALWKRCLLPGVSTCMVLLAVFTPTLERNALGAIPSLFDDDVGMHWKLRYSFQTITNRIASFHGGDWLLFVTISSFIVVGPILRSWLCLCCWIWPHSRHRPWLSVMVESLGAFCAWEVLIVAIFEVSVLIPKITTGLVWRRECAAAAAITSSSYGAVPQTACITVQLQFLSSFVVVLVAMSCLSGTAWIITKRTTRTIPR